MKEILVLLALGALVSSLPLNSEWDNVWDEWKTKHGKEYVEGDEVPRRMIWEETMRMIDQHNLEEAQGKHSYTMGMNQFGDMTLQEYNAMLSASADDESPLDEIPVSEGNKSVSKTPSNWDWRDRGHVTPVKNQGDCGSCYAFSSVGALEAHLSIKTGKLLDLSEQELVDCSGKYGNNGCKGGHKDNSLLYIKDHGIMSERQYPYTKKVGKCKSLNAKKTAWCKGYQKINSLDESAMKAKLYSVGPLAVSCNVSYYSFKQYKSGVIYENVLSRGTTHAMVAVGYGAKSDRARHNYWIVKNSWGKSWGAKGYVLIARGNNQYNIATKPLYPLL